ncbi:MAG: L-threonylcarbamoyladenylate synthase, partial [Bacteroidia bacterium]
VPNHPLTLDLLYGLYFPLAAPSANPFEYVSPTNPFHVLEQLGDEIEFILDGGDCQVGIESTIIRLENNRIEILRQGGITKAELESKTKLEVVVLDDEKRQNMPGSHKKHYSNNKNVELFENGEKAPNLNQNECALLFSKPQIEIENCFYLCENGDTTEAAQNLFKILRELGKSSFDKIFIEKAPQKGLGPAINERLVRAAAQ